jgi:rare lipoprotein A
MVKNIKMPAVCDRQRTLNLLLFFIVVLLVSACAVRDGAPPDYTKQWHEIPDAVPEPVTPSKYGNPKSYEALGKKYYVMESVEEFEQSGVASWYGNKFHGRRTSSGEEYDMYAMTAAHKTLPIPVYVEVKNHDNGRKAIVKVNDRGPFHDGRIIDLSYAAATRLGVAQTGTAKVTIRVVTPDDNKNSRNTQGLVKSTVSDDDKLYVQVAAFSTKKSALKYLEKLQAEGFFDVRLHVETVPDKVIYRVRIGPLPSQHVAKNVLSQLEDNDYHNLKIVKNN